MSNDEKEVLITDEDVIEELIDEAIEEAIAEEIIEEILEDELDEIIKDEIIEEVTEEFIEEQEELEQEVEDYKLKYLEALAQMENLRKRLDSDRSEIIKYRASSFIQNILPTMDMFKMALSSQNVSEEVKNWLIGFEMILRNFEQSFEQEGVKEIKINIGDEFDATYHQAIDEKETDEFESGKIMEIKNKGYMLHDRLLRPASVVVAKKATTEEAE